MELAANRLLRSSMNITGRFEAINKFKQWIRRAHRVVVRGSKIDFFAPEDNARCDAISRAFVINLDRQPGRWSSFKKEARIQKMSCDRNLLDFCERVPAIDGRTIKGDVFYSREIDKLYSLNEHLYVDPDPALLHRVQAGEILINMTPAEIAVALSHLKVWKRIVDEKVSYALVLEDDVFFDTKFAEQANQAWRELPRRQDCRNRFDLLYFSYREVDHGADKQVYSESLCHPVRGLWWLSAYVLSYSGARALLELLPIRGPVDMWINHQFSKLDVFATSQSIIFQRNDWKSDNMYSVLPLIARLGVQPDRSAVSTKGFQGRRPVFAIGLNKTGTTSLHFALSLLGYRCCHWVSDRFSEDTARLIDSNQLLPFDAYTDVACVVERYRQLDRQYPSAAFILTTRNLEEWIASRARHVIRNRRKNAAGALHTWTALDPSSWIKERSEHHKAVLQYFEDRADKLLVLDICGGDGWEPLCKFLGVPVPDVAFPSIDPLLKVQTISRNLDSRIPIKRCACQALRHDVHPWIEQPSTLDNYCGPVHEPIRNGTRTGSFSPVHVYGFETISPIHWEILENSFPSNLAMFRSQNICLLDEGGFRMILRSQKVGSRYYTSGSIKSKTKYRFSRFEVKMKPAKAIGVVSAFFLYRIDPWQEIDFEFVGNDTTRLLANVYYNPGEEGTANNYGTRGTPILIDLGFDASCGFHNYAIEWDPNEIRWFVDEELVHARPAGKPTPIPSLPMAFYINTWPSRSVELAGELRPSILPVSCEVRSVIISTWVPP